MILDDGSGLYLVHFVYPSAAGLVKSKGMPLGPARQETYKVACVPDMLEMAANASRGSPWQRTDDVRAVTCPLCIRTEEFQKAKDQLAAALAARQVKIESGGH